MRHQHPCSAELTNSIVVFLMLVFAMLAGRVFPMVFLSLVFAGI